MKALLINGARSLATNGLFVLEGSTNAQAWGVVNLTNSIPAGLSNSFAAAPAPVQIFDESPPQALATGQRYTRFVTLCPAATNAPIRFTLVWTDPPANPAAGVKLVNNLDLVVTNLQTGQVFVGNDIPPDAPFNRPCESGTPSRFDQVNNVENIFLPPSLATNYSVTVSGFRRERQRGHGAHQWSLSRIMPWSFRAATGKCPTLSLSPIPPRQRLPPRR